MMIENIIKFGKNMYTTSSTTNQDLNMMSLYEYLGRAAGSELGKMVANEATKQKIVIAEKHVNNPKYKGKILMYPKNFLDKFFNK